MGITVNWNGTETTITGSNAYAIYEDWVQGEIDLSTSQIKMCESFLTDEEIDEIEYNNGGDEKTGAAAIGDDAENAENSSNQTANAGATAGASAGLGTAVMLMAKKAKEESPMSGFTALSWAIATTVASAAAYAAVLSFDSEYGDRTSARDNADSTNSTLDGYTSSLEENFDTMNDDMDAYSEASEYYTTTVNDRTSQLADLQVQLEAAQAAGDTAGAESIQSEIDALNESEVDTEEMDELKEKMTEYQSLGSEAGGASGAGQSVADFLKTGTPLGVLALADGAYLAIAAVLTVLNVGAAVEGAEGDAAKWNWAGFGAGIAGSILYGIAAAVLAGAGTKMLLKGKNEIECGSAGSGMQGHVNTLNDMIGEHSAYMEATTEAYDETDAESQESQQEAAEAAAEVTANGGTVSKSGSTSDDEDEKKTAV